MTAPNAQVVSGTAAGFGGIATATSVQFFIKNAAGTQTTVGTGGLLFPPNGWVIAFNSTTKTDGQYTATCQATGTGGVGAMSTPVPFAIHNQAANLAAPAASKRGAKMGFGQTLANAQEADAEGTQGTGWVRGGFEWQWLINKSVDIAHGGNVDPNNSATWPWAVPAQGGGLSYDQEVQHAHALGLKFLAVALGSPYYANDAATDGHYYPNAAHVADWQVYIRGLIEHGADAVEVWNEPNNAPSFIDVIDPAAQAGLQRNTYDFVKANWPTVPVISGGFTAFTAGLDFCDYQQTWFDPHSPAGFLVGEYAAAAASYNGGKTFAGSFDGLGNHPYALDNITPGSGFGATYPDVHFCGDGVSHTVDLLTVMSVFGDVKPLWLTEYGSKGTGVAPANIGPYMTGYLNGFILLRALGVPIGATFAFSMHASADEATNDDSSYGVYHYDWSEKPSAAIIRADAATTADTAVPTISGVSVTATGLTTATLSWTTNETATTSVRYGATTSYGQAVGGPSGTNHSVTLTGVTPGATLNYVIDSYDGSANKSAAPNRTFAMPKPYATPIKKAANATVATTAAFNTTGPALILALVQAGGPNAASSQTVSVSSTTPGLSFGASPLVRANGLPGDSEIWSATTTAALTGAIVTSTEATGPYHQTITILVLSKAAGIGNSGGLSLTSSTPVAFLQTSQTGSLLFGGGLNYTTAAVPALTPDETLITSTTVAATTEAMWTQYLETPTPSSLPVEAVFGTLAQSDQWNFAGVEVKTT